jgi:hypothetical protein
LIWKVTEGSLTTLDGFAFEWLPGYLSKALRFVHRDGKNGIEVGNYIGIVPLLNGHTLQILPKYGETNFIRMLFTSEQLMDSFSDEYDQMVYFQNSDEIGLHKIIARSFHFELLRIRATSLRFERRPLKQRSQFAKGRLFAIETKKNLLALVNDPVVFTEMVREYNTPEHRVIASAAIVAAQYVNEPFDLLSWASSYLSRSTILDDISVVENRLRRHYYSNSRGYYYNILTLSRILLSQAGLTCGISEDLAGDAILVNSASLYENYLRAILSTNYEREGYIIRKGFMPTEHLYIDCSFELLPDICIYNRNSCILCGDAKYRIPDSKDHYQLRCYSLASNLKSATLFYPAKKTTDKIVARKTKDGCTIFEFPVFLSDLDYTEQLLANLHTSGVFL